MGSEGQENKTNLYAVSPHLWLKLGHELEDESLCVLLMLRVGEVQVSAEVLVQPGGEVVPRL